MMQPIETDVDRARGLEAKLRTYAADVSLDPNSPIPLHYQLFRILRQFARRHEVTTDDRLPPEELVARVFGVSRPTAARAIRGFVDRQQLTRTPGRGSFFRSNQQLDLTLLANSLSVLDAVHPPHELTTEVIAQMLTGSVPRAVQRLGLSEESVAVFLRRLRSIDGQPVMVCDSYLPAELFPGLQDEELVRGSLYATLESAYKTRIVESDRFIEVTELVDRRIMQLLDVPILSPVFVLTGLSYDESGRLCEAIVSHILGEVRFSSTVRTESGSETHGVSEGEPVN
jgi:GntR family transcriptional regulator